MAEGIRVFEVGLRDGLQNEKTAIRTSQKLKWLRELLEAGITDFEIGAFVRSDRVPNMSDTEALIRKIRTPRFGIGKAQPWTLVPNSVGLDRAIQAGAENIAVFTAATDGFSKANVGLSVEKSLAVVREVVKKALSLRMRVRGYVSTAFGCPYEGRVPANRALYVIEKLAEFGVEQVSIGDTLGVATPKEVDALIRPSLLLLGKEQTAVHFHDTRGLALANTLRSIELGVRSVDSSSAGLGGCPFAPGAAGNLATEDLIYMLNGLGMKTGIDLDRLCKANSRFIKLFKRPPSSRYLASFLGSKGHWPHTAKAKMRSKR